MRKETNKRFFRNESGAVAVTYALALLPLIAIAGLGYDYARLAGMDTELQNAADQAALAGATQLDRTDGSMQRAINAIQGDLVQNYTLFSNDSTGTAQINVTNTTDVQIVFYANKADAEAGQNSFTDVTRFAEAGFVGVTVDTRRANYALTPVVGALYGDINAEAVAGLGSALCRVPPLMICNPDESTQLTMDIAGRKGFGLLAKPGGGGQWVPGNYGYLDVGLANGAVGVRQALGWGSAGNCIAQVGPSTVDTQTGNIANAPGAANTRFDVYENNACETGGACPSAINVRKDMVRPNGSTPGSGKTCEVDKTGWQLPYEGTKSGSDESLWFLGDAYLPTNATTYTHTPQSMGHPRDKCHSVYDGAPGNCWTAQGNFGNGIWDRDTYFRVNYGWTNAQWTAALAGATLVNSPNVANISRYDVYKWEESKIGTTVSSAVILGDRTYTSTDGSGDQFDAVGRSICSNEHGFTPISAPDRRKLSVAVVNCNTEGVSGSSTNVPVVQWVDVFLVQVAADRQYGGKHFTGKDELYVEIIDVNTTRGTGSTDGITIRRDVPYLVR